MPPEGPYEELRSPAFAVAYQSPSAWTAAVVTRLSIDELRSARARRERYVGEWLPEPLVGDEGGIPPPGRSCPTRCRSPSW